MNFADVLKLSETKPSKAKSHLDQSNEQKLMCVAKAKWGWKIVLRKTIKIENA